VRTLERRIPILAVHSTAVASDYDLIMASPKVPNPKRSARYYRENPEARRKKAEYEKKYQAQPAQRKKAAERRKWRRANGLEGKGGPDASHTKDGKLVRESASKNRARNRGRK